MLAGLVGLVPGVGEEASLEYFLVVRPAWQRPGGTMRASGGQGGRVKADKVQYVVDEDGRQTAVILPLEEYEELLEDLHDLAVIAERREEPTVRFEDLKKKLEADGLL